MLLTDGRQAKAARAMLGLKQDELARLAGVHLNSISRLEGRQELSPRCRSTGERIADAMAPLGIRFESRPDVLAVVFMPGTGQ